MSRRVQRMRSELKNPAYEIFIGLLSVMSIVNLVLVYAFSGDGAMQLVLSVTNALFSLIFLIDFIYRFSTSAARWKYLLTGFGWADLLASLPFPELKILRIFRLLRVFRLMRALGMRTILSTLAHDRANSTLMTLLLLGILVLQFGSLSILAVEGHAGGANITSASDALWYTLVTISTVGYGDQYPVTNAGRLLGVLIIIVGIGIFGTFTGYLANVFLGPLKSEPVHHRLSGRVGADAAPAGVAAGAAAGAVAAGISAQDGRESGTPDDARDQRLRALLAQAEAMQAEIRALLAGGGPSGPPPPR